MQLARICNNNIYIEYVMIPEKAKLTTVASENKLYVEPFSKCLPILGLVSFMHSVKNQIKTEKLKILWEKNIHDSLLQKPAYKISNLLFKKIKNIHFVQCVPLEIETILKNVLVCSVCLEILALKCKNHASHGTETEFVMNSRNFRSPH